MKKIFDIKIAGIASEPPIGFGPQTDDAAILRQGIIAEADAVSLYEQMARSTKNKKLQKLLLDIVKEEKTHMGEFEALLLEIDKEQEQEQEQEIENGKKEVKDLIG